MANAFTVQQVTQRLLADKYGRWEEVFGEDLLARVVERIADECSLQNMTDNLTPGSKQTVSSLTNAEGLRP